MLFDAEMKVKVICMMCLIVIMDKSKPSCLLIVRNVKSVGGAEHVNVEKADRGNKGGAHG